MMSLLLRDLSLPNTFTSRNPCRCHLPARTESVMQHKLHKAFEQWVGTLEEHDRIRAFAKRLFSRGLVMALGSWATAAAQRVLEAPRRTPS